MISGDGILDWHVAIELTILLSNLKLFDLQILFHPLDVLTFNCQQGSDFEFNSETLKVWCLKC